MKKIIVTLIALTFSIVAIAQSETDTVAPVEEVIEEQVEEVSVDAVAKEEVGVGTNTPQEEPVRRLSRRQEMKYFGHDFSRWFCEVQYLYGRQDVAIGLNLTFLPETWGGYISGYYGVNANWFMLGAVHRFSSIHNRLDFQVYAGLAFGYGCGAEAGIRLSVANPRKRCKFSWLSVSMGGVVTNDGSFVTCGLSLPFGVPTAALVLW
jgi:hypothetical protein